MLRMYLRSCGVVSQGPADFAYEDLDVIWMDVGVGPDGAEQDVPGDHVTRLLDEHAKNMEGFVRQGDPDVPPPERLRRKVHPERCKILHVGTVLSRSEE